MHADPRPATGANAIVRQRRHRDRGRLLGKASGQRPCVSLLFWRGCLGQGVLYEVMNLGQLAKLPVIYVCENNLYTEYTHYSETTAGDILARAARVP
jgi:TPP-dependent pyruvate/acetoin dehydrogenase alpha subunit